MINVIAKRCELCNKIPSFGFPGDPRPRFCSDHAEEGMVNLVKAKCEFPGCMKSPSFNFPGEVKGRYCKQHAEDNMINIKSKKCEVDGCMRQASFNFEGSPGSRFCADHRETGMVNISAKTRLCQHEGCTVQANFNLPGQKPGRFCHTHALNGMVNVTTDTCSHSGCPKQARYGKLFSPKKHCGSHKEPNEYAKNNPKCEHQGCPNRPMFTDTTNNYPERCEDHKKTNDKNVIERPCKSCGLPNFINEEVQLCNDCNDFINKRVHKVKETEIGLALGAHNIPYDPPDKRVPQGCTLYRPDFPLATHQLFKPIVEVDEDQHKSHSRECELARMFMLYQDYGGLPVLFIRYNPDSYKFDNKTIRASKSREKVLIDFIFSLRNVNTIKHPIVVCYLFYDGFDGTIKFHALDYSNGSVTMTPITDVFN